MTKLTEYIEDGWNVMISEMVSPGTPFAAVDAGFYPNGEIPKTLVFHPLDYNYVAYDDIFVAHEKNMDWIQHHIEDMAAKACRRIDDMTESFHDFWKPKTVMFFDETRVHENPDGTFSFEVLNPLYDPETLVYSHQEYDPPILFEEYPPDTLPKGYVKVTKKETTDEDR